MNLNSTTCILTGADGLIGQACARTLAEYGADLITLDRKFNKALGEQVEIDITQEAEVKNFFNTLPSRRTSSKHWAFIHAAYPRTDNWGKLSFEKTSLEDWNTNVALQLGSAFLFSQLAAEFMKTRAGGSIVHLSSIYGLVGPDLSLYEGTAMVNPSPYAAIKAGLLGLSRSITSIYGPFNVRSNIVCPGGIEDRQPASFIEAYNKRTPLKRMGRPEDISGIVAFLCSPSASYISGAVIPVDGGFTAL